MNNELQEHHVMVLEKTYPSGTEEWYCPTCGRRFLMQWPPDYKKVVLDAGDEYAIHSGGKGGLVIGGPMISQDQESAYEDNARLAQWDEWLTKLDFENWWNRDS